MLIMLYLFHLRKKIIKLRLFKFDMICYHFSRVGVDIRLDIFRLFIFDLTVF